MTKRSSLFAKFDLDYADHPKIAPVSDAAFRAHVEMILYSRRYLTDGRIAKRIAKRWPEGALTELLSNDEESPSLILLDDGDYLLHDYSTMQETKEEIEARKAVNRENGRRGGLAKGRSAKRVASKSLSETLSEKASENVAETETETETERTSDSSAEEIRPDMAEILDHLDRELEANNFKKPNRVQSNIRAARLLMDRDGHTVDEIKSIISFAQSSEFWMPNIRSMSKLREKYDTLQAQASRPGPKADPRVAVANDPWTREGPF